MGFTMWFDSQKKEVKIGLSFVFIIISSLIGWFIGDVLFVTGWSLQQMLSLIAMSCTIVLIIVIYLIIKLKSD